MYLDHNPRVTRCCPRHQITIHYISAYWEPTYIRIWFTYAGVLSCIYWFRHPHENRPSIYVTHIRTCTYSKPHTLLVCACKMCSVYGVCLCVYGVWLGGVFVCVYGVCLGGVWVACAVCMCRGGGWCVCFLYECVVLLPCAIAIAQNFVLKFRVHAYFALSIFYEF